MLDVEDKGREENDKGLIWILTPSNVESYCIV